MRAMHGKQVLYLLLQFLKILLRNFWKCYFPKTTLYLYLIRNRIDLPRPFVTRKVLHYRNQNALFLVNRDRLLEIQQNLLIFLKQIHVSFLCCLSSVLPMDMSSDFISFLINCLKNLGLFLRLFISMTIVGHKDLFFILSFLKAFYLA